MKKASSERNLLYLFFHRPAPKLEGNFHTNKLMQKLSKERLIFVDLKVPKRPSAEIRRLVKRYGLKRLPYALIADRFGNLLFSGASSKDSELLSKQVVVAEKRSRKLVSSLEAMYYQARKYCKKRDYRAAVRVLFRVKKRDVKGLEIVKKIEWLYGRIDEFMERQLKKVVRADISAERKKRLLLKLKTKVHENLSTYDKLIVAYQQCGREA